MTRDAVELMEAYRTIGMQSASAAMQTVHVMGKLAELYKNERFHGYACPNVLR